MGFLYPAFAAAALAAAVPILLHLIRRRDVRRMVFPAIRYLRRAEQRHARRLRLRHLALLAARVVIVLLAAAAAAGPLIGRGGPSDHRPTAVAIIIDDSQSSGLLLGERRLLDLFIDRASRSLTLLNAGDRAALFSAARGDGPLTTDISGARSYLDGLQPTAGLADLPATLRQATAWLRSVEGLAREIHLLTDLQRVSLLPRRHPSSADESETGAGIGAVVYVPEIAPPDNGAVGVPLPEVQPLTAGRETAISVTPRWFADGKAELDSTVVRMFVGLDLVAVGLTEFAQPAILRLPPQMGGWTQGHVEIDRSGLPADDRRFFTWPTRAPARFAVLGDPGEFVGHALDALERGGRIESVGAAAADVWISEAAAGLEAGLTSGTAVIVLPPADPLDLPRTNARLALAGMAWRYEVPSSDRGVATLSTASPLPGLANLAVRHAYRLTRTALTPRDSVLLTLSDGQPWLIRGPTPRGDAVFLLLASPLLPAFADVPISAAMIPFLDALLGEWSRSGSIEPTNLEGVASIRLPPRAREIRYPDGTKARVEGGAWLTVSDAGNYRVLDYDTVRLAFSLNAPPAEADLSRGARQELEARLPSADWAWSAALSADGWEEAVFRERRGRLAWRPLIVLLLLISLIEASLAAAGRRRASRFQDSAEGYGGTTHDSQ